MHRKGIVIGIIILMLGVNIGSTFAGDVDVKTISSVGFDGDTLYVGGSGPNNYTTIQSAINDAVDGDTVFVYSGTYEENITINKSINLIGENRETTIIDDSTFPYGNLINVIADNVTISFFTMTGSIWNTIAILLYSSNITICNNDIIDCDLGIVIYSTSHNNQIYDNYLYWNEIMIYGSDNNFIYDNYLDTSDIRFTDSDDNTIRDNHFSQSTIYMGNPNYNLIVENYFIMTFFGIVISGGGYNIICDNYFTGVTLDSIRLRDNSLYNHIFNNTIYNCNEGSIRIQQSDYNIIDNNNISFNGEGGILIFSSDNCNVSYNYLFNNRGGISVVQISRNNIVFRNMIKEIQGIGLIIDSHHEVEAIDNIMIENTVQDCHKGLYLERSNRSIICRNNFINNGAEYECINSITVWDDGVFGNYWEEYSGKDDFGDGIGDTSYVIDGDSNQDKFPLMVPYGLGPGVEIKTPEEGFIYFRNLRIPYFFGFLNVSKTRVFGNIKIIASAANYDEGVEIERVEFYIDDFLRKSDSEPPYDWRWRLSSHIIHRHTLTVVTYDTNGNSSSDEIKVWRFL